jgi:hypothetical protein
MNAVVKPVYKRVLDELKDSVRYDRIPLETIVLEAEECIRWIDEEGKKPETLTYYMTDAVAELDGKKQAKSDALIAKLLTGTMTADELIEWRDLQRSALIDYCTDWARRKVDLELELE